MGRARGRGKSRESGPNYPSRLLREIGLPLDLNDRKRRHSRKSSANQPESIASDVYEYQEGVPQEESGKNRRFDSVDKLEYELPSDFEDEEIDEGAVSGDSNENSDESEDHDEDVEEDEEEEDDGGSDEEERHERLLEEVSGKFNRTERKNKEESFSTEAGNEELPITVEDLLAPLKEKPGFNALKKRIRTLQKSATPVSVPLPRTIQEKIDRKAGYEKTIEDITKWQPLVKTNREAPTLNFIKRADVSFPTSSSMAADFKPSTAFEKEIAALLKRNGVRDPYQIEAMENLQLNKLSVEEVRDRQQRLAKMRSLLFRHEERAKRIKKIKSKTFHRLERKSKKSKADVLADDPDLRLEETMQQELKRAQERMTLKHKNTSRWAKRILKRGLQQHNEGTREAITEQLREHALLTRKIHSADVESSSGSEKEDDSDEDDEAGLVLKKPASKVLAKAKIATLKALEEGNKDTEMPNTGIFALPFMVRAIEKKRKEAENEARAVLEELESAETSNANSEDTRMNGKLSFGDLAKPTPVKSLSDDDFDMVERDSEISEDEHQGSRSKTEKTKRKSRTIASATVKPVDTGDVHLDGMVSSAVEHTTKVEGPITIAGTNTNEKAEGKNKKKKMEDSIDMEIGQKSVISANPTIFGTKEITLEPRENGNNATADRSLTVTIAGRPTDTSQKEDERPNSEQENSPELEDDADDNDDDEDDNVIVPRTQEELIREAFAGDDVEAEFEEMKAAAINEECPLPALDQKEMPGWGQWTEVQKRTGPPRWMIREQEAARKTKAEAEKRRLDAKLKHVIISEKADKKGAKFLSSAIPFPYTSKELFEKTMRMPLGRDYNATKTFQDLTRPSVIKRAGVIIDPIKYEESKTVKDDTTKKKRKHEESLSRESPKDRKTQAKA